MATPRAARARRLGSLFDQATEPTFALDSEGRFLFVNRAWEELTGWSAGSVLGQSAAGGPGTGGPEEAGGFSPPADGARGGACGGDTLIVRGDGGRLWRRVEFRPYRGPSGELLGLLGSVPEAGAAMPWPEAPDLSARAELNAARRSLLDRHGSVELLGRGPRHDRLLAQVRAAAAVESPCAIVGEPGTGRKHVARAIHRAGRRPEAPLLVVDVPALPADLLARALFGAGPMEAGRDRPSVADGSTLVLNEVVRLPRDVQARLAASIGGWPVRLIAVSALDLDDAARDEVVRGDLAFALTVATLRLDPLRERLEELPLLAQHFLDRKGRTDPARPAYLAPEALDAMLAYDWPGNLAELARVVAAAAARAQGAAIHVGDLPAEIRGELAAPYLPTPRPEVVTPLDDWLARLERRMIEQALARAHGNKSRAAELLDISRPRLYRRIKELAIVDEGEPDGTPTNGDPPRASTPADRPPGPNPNFFGEPLDRRAGDD